MNFYYGVLLAVVIFMSTNVSSKIATADILDRSVVEIQRRVSNRFLRTYDEVDAERVFGIKSIPGADKVSSYVNKQKLAKYLNNNKDTDVVFTKLKLDQAGDKLFDDPKFLSWLKYVENYNIKNRDKEKSILPTLMRHYDDDTLAKMLEEAKQIPSMKRIATGLQDQQMQLWKSQRLSLNGLFMRYNLDGASNPFSNPAINIVARYADEFTLTEKTTLFNTFQKYYPDMLLSRWLMAAKKVPSTEKLAVDLQSLQINFWLSKLESPESVFKLLRLDKGADNLFDNSQLNLWLQYASSFEQKSKANPFVEKSKTTLAEMLTIHYDGTLSTVLDSATSPYSKRVAAVLEVMLLKFWAESGKSLEYVTKTLGPSPEKTKFLETAYLKILTN